MFNPTRDQARRFLIETWQKFQRQEPLVGLEKTATEVLVQHPEYHRFLDERYLERDYLPEDGEINPFLHLNLHLAIEEQLSINQPPGIQAHYQRLLAACGDAMTSRHHLMDCLAETIWQAQRSGSAPDALLYLSCLEQKP
jgi:hypothetical protein